jgi:integrase
MATVLKRSKKSKRWTGVFTDKDGKQVWQALFADKAESLRTAQRLEDEARRVRIGDLDPQADARRVERARPAAEHLSGFRESLEANVRAANHVAYTIRDVELFIAHAGVTHSAGVTRRHVDAFRTHCLTVGFADARSMRMKRGPDEPAPAPKPDSRKTVNRRVASVRAWLYWCMQAGVIDRNPLHKYGMLATKGHETRHRRALSREELDALLATVGDCHRGDVYRFAAYTGFRREEIASFTTRSFDLSDQPTVTITAAKAKNKKDHQTLPLHRDLVPIVTRLIAGAPSLDAPLFKTPPKNDAVKIIRADLAAAGVEDVGRVDFHALRHTFITMLAAQQIRPEILQKLARHRNIQTTMSYYVHWRPQDERLAVERL